MESIRNKLAQGIQCTVVSTPLFCSVREREYVLVGEMENWYRMFGIEVLYGSDGRCMTIYNLLFDCLNVKLHIRYYKPSSVISITTMGRRLIRTMFGIESVYTSLNDDNDVDFTVTINGDQIYYKHFSQDLKGITREQLIEWLQQTVSITERQAQCVCDIIENRENIDNVFNSSS